MASDRVTLAIINGQLTSLNATLLKHVEDDSKQFGLLRDLIQGQEDKPGIKGRLDRLEQEHASRIWHLRALWAATIGAFLTWLFQRH